jgi:hypothetical protein
MPEMTIRLIPDPATGKKNIIISLRGDEDALPHEHEQMHRKLVEKVLSGNRIKLEEIGQITVEREQDEKEPASPVSSPPQQERRSVGQGH